MRTPTRKGLIAHAGGGQSSALALTAGYNHITTCATAGDSLKLPAGILGVKVSVYNDGAEAADVYGQSGAGIDGGAADAAVRIQPGELVTYTAISATVWESNNPASGAVTQLSSVTTGVTLNKKRGIITTVASTAGAAGATPNIFTVTNSYVQASSNVRAWIVDHTGAGNPTVIVDNVTAGAFDIQVSSISAAALDNVHKIGFEVLN